MIYSLFIVAVNLIPLHDLKLMRTYERLMRIELTSKAWQAFILPLNYNRLMSGRWESNPHPLVGSQG